MARVLLLDTHALFFRAFFALPPMSTKTGVPTSALYGLAVLVLKLLREERPLGLAFALDAGPPTFRHAQSPTYKANRPPLPDALRQQLDALPRFLDALGAPCFVAPGFEADDVLATLARELGSSNPPVDVRIVTTDHDLFQVVRDGVDVLFVGARGAKPTLYDREALVARYGLTPPQLPSLAALVGDTADNLPKVPGIGARTAQKLVHRFGDTPPKLRATLAAASAQMLETESLARLRDDVPLPSGPRMAPVGAEAWPRLRALFTEWEFGSLLARVDRLSKPDHAPAEDDQLRLDV